MNHMNEIFLDPHELLLKPKMVLKIIYYLYFIKKKLKIKRTNALYFLLLGKMEIYNNTKESKNLLKDLILNKSKKLLDSVELPSEQTNFIHCLDDDLKDFPHLFQQDCRLVLNKLGSLNVGDMIGGISFENNQPKSDFYYLTESACHFCVFTQAVKKINQFL